MKVMIGLESHVQVISDSKLFCGCRNPFGMKEDPSPNTLTCPTCLGLPGAKPVVNRQIINSALKVAIALECKISKEMFFSRKTYFYPDQSKNFQITQYDIPLAENGKVSILVGGKVKQIKIKRLHIEEDPAKLIHSGSGRIGTDSYSLVDYNRAGSPLIEIVTEPDFSSPEEARIYMQKLESICEYLKIYNPSTIGVIKSDANISIEGGKRVEIKNITGSKEMESALKYEIVRQKNLLAKGTPIVRETRMWNPELGITRSLRGKEMEEEYGYIFEPDLPKITFTSKIINEVKISLPELPDQKYQKFIKKLPEKVAESLISDPGTAELFENVSKKVDPRIAGTWIAGYLKKTLNWHNLRFFESGIKPEWVASLLKLFENGKITDRGAEMAIRKMIEEKKPPEDIIKKYGLGKADIDLKGIVSLVVKRNRVAVDDYRKGNKKAIEFLVGQVIKETKGCVDANEIRKELIKVLK